MLVTSMIYIFILFSIQYVNMSSTNWSLCVVCQEDTGDLRSTDAGLRTLSRNIPKLFRYAGALLGFL